ncbi:MAG: GAF domain-containing protein [Dehalococcoidia bacterium]|nr:GAF domain-containing protein [Dehalococcoidia bacterium]MDZ4278257.1 GAF domain-containing protein [Dehalococcoidia bacterium]
MTQQGVKGRVTRDPEYRALRHLARTTAPGIPDRPLDALQQVADLARELTAARYAALVVTGQNDYVEGFVVSGLTPEEERKLKAAPQGHGPLGTMRQDGVAVRIDDLERYARSFGFPPKHPEMKSLLGVPIWTGGQLRGALYVTDRERAEAFRDDDEVALAVLARHAGSIIADRWY